VAAADGSLYAVLCVAQSLSEIEKMRAQLHITNERYNAAITSSRLGVFEYDPATNRLVVDSNLRLLLSGQAAEIHTLDDALAYIPIEDHGHIYKTLSTVLTGKSQQLELEIRARSADRGLRWLLVRGAFNAQEQRLFGTLMDVTDRKVAEDDLENRDRIMRAVAQASEVFLHAPNWEDNLMSMLEELGRSAKVSRVYVFKNHLAPDNQTLLCSQIAEWCLDPNQSQMDNPSLQNQDMRATGFERWQHKLGGNEVLHGVVESFPESERELLRAQKIQSILVAPIQVNNTWWGYIGFDECDLPLVWQQSMIDALKLAADILGAAIFRTEADRELEAGREFILNTMTNLGQGVAVVDGKGKLVYVNPAYAQMIGLPTEQVEGRQYTEFTPSETGASVPPTGSHVTHLYNVDGQMIEVLVTSVQRVPEGKPDGAYCVIADITDRRRIEEQRFELLLEKERMRLMSGFIRDMSHEFRTPLSIIQTSLYLLRRKPDHPQASNRLDTIGAQAARLNRLVDDLMLMLELEQADIVPRMLSLNTLAAHVLSQNVPKAEAKRLTIGLQQPDGEVLVSGEEGYLSRAAMMLVDNAIEFTPEGGNITLGVQRDTHYAMLRVSDTGIGIPPEELDNIFEHMYKVDKARNTERGGLGLGLSIVRRIAALHHGQITVESTPGQGSTFVLKIPHPEPPSPKQPYHQTLTQEISAVLITATDEVGRVETE
jgi:PAS domain S-box-containing protein